MKQTINIFAFFFVLSIPFALSSQTRKAIPAGRYEALSGVKNSRVVKTEQVMGEKKDSASLFWNEVLSHIPENAQDVSYFTAGKMDEFSTNLLGTKGLKVARNLNEQTSIIFSDDLKRDRSLLQNLKNKSSLVVLKDTHQLKEVVASLGQFDVLLYQVEDQSHYFLLKLK